MLHFRQATLRANGQEYALTPGRINSFEAFYVDFQQDDADRSASWSLFVHPKEDLLLQSVEVQFSLPSLADGSPVRRMLANGFQSWSESRLLPVTAGLPRLRWFARKSMGHSGDEHIAGIPRGNGLLHAWSYTWLTNDQPDAAHALLLASTNESTGFTLFIYDEKTQVLTVRKDLNNNGLRLSHSFPALAFTAYSGRESEVFDRHFGPRKVEAAGGLGWTSWYQHFTQISETLLLHNLQSVVDSELPFEYFQIDDGWQTAVGDWLSVKAEFPGGMGQLAQKIRQQGLKPGLWLAPFVAADNSELVRKHPEWLLKGPNGQPLRVGKNPMWGGWYHALDFYQPGVRDYLSGVFHVVGAQWGFELLKLDFLFAVCLAPPPGKTRGQVMHEAVEFLRQQVGSKTQILGCGVPLGSSLGQVDAMRVSGDIHLRWQHRLLTWLRHRERVDTLAALRTTLSRWQLGGRAWRNDPDVFVLRSERQHLSPTQQHTVLTVNALLGQMLFTSDDVAQYTPEQRSELESALALRGSHIVGVNEIQPDVYYIDFQQNNLSGKVFCNLNGKAVSLLWDRQHLALDAYETLVFF